MNVQWSKEWRLLGPGMVAAVGLAILPLMLPVEAQVDSQNRDEVSYLMSFCMFVGGVMLGVEAFGREFHQKTSTLWMALPMARASLWRFKLLPLSGAVAGVVLLHWAVLLGVAPWRGFYPGAWEVVRTLVGITVGAALGVCWSLVLRQTWAALWMALIVPGALMLLIQLLVVVFWPAGEYGKAVSTPNMAGMFAFGFCTLGIIAMVAARRGFNRLEDLGPVGEDVQLRLPSRLRLWGEADVQSDEHGLSATRALWWKEFRLQQVNITLAGGFAVIMLLVQVLRQVAMRMPERFGPNDIEVFDYLWALWSLLPLTIGLASLAEERRLGVDAWQETLPVSRRRRWWIKVGATYGIAFIIGVLVPVVGESITRSDPVVNMMVFHCLAWLIMTTAGIYVSSLARNLVHAISILLPFGVLLALSSASGLWGVAMLGPGPIDRYAWIPMEWHFYTVFSVLLFVALMWLAWRNAVPGMSHGQGALWRFNGGTIAVVWLVSVLVVAGSRTRIWERLRVEPAALPALNLVEGVEPGVEVMWWYVAVLTPEGSLWTYGSPGEMQGPIAVQQLGAGHTWLSMGAGEYHVHAVRSDGTLWRWGQESVFDPSSKRWMRQGDLASSWLTPAAVNAETDWQAVASCTTHSVALKSDGTLWGWGNNLDGQLGETETSYVSTPMQIGSGANWTCIAAGQSASLAANRNGEVWLWGQGRGRRGADGQSRFANPERIATGPTWNRLILQGEQILGWTVAGEVRILRENEWMSRWHQPGMAESIRAVEIVPDVYEVWAIVESGSLLQWYRAGPEFWYSGRAGLPPVEDFRRIGNRSDWIAMDADYGQVNFLGLTADGGLWNWGMGFGKREQPWLPPSQRPRQVAMLRAAR